MGDILIILGGLIGLFAFFGFWVPGIMAKTYPPLELSDASINKLSEFKRLAELKVERRRNELMNTGLSSKDQQRAIKEYEKEMREEATKNWFESPERQALQTAEKILKRNKWKRIVFGLIFGALSYLLIEIGLKIRP